MMQREFLNRRVKYMAINRFDLIHAISNARRNKDDDIYDELLKLYYCLLKQEEINDNFIINFNTHNTISQSAQNMLSKGVMLSHGR